MGTISRAHNCAQKGYTWKDVSRALERFVQIVGTTFVWFLEGL